MELCPGLGKTADKRRGEKRGGKEKKEKKKEKSSTEPSQSFHISQKSPWSLLTVLVCGQQQTFN